MMATIANKSTGHGLSRAYVDFKFVLPAQNIQLRSVGLVVTWGQFGLWRVLNVEFASRHVCHRSILTLFFMSLMTLWTRSGRRTW